MNEQKEEPRPERDKKADLELPKMDLDTFQEFQEGNLPAVGKNLLKRYVPNLSINILIFFLGFACFGLLFSLIQSSKKALPEIDLTPGAVVPAVSAAELPTSTPAVVSVVATPTPVVIVAAAAEPVYARESHIVNMLEGLTSSMEVVVLKLLEEGAKTPVPGYETNPTPIFITPSAPAVMATVEAPAAPVLPEVLSIWEDGNCWAPPSTQVLNLCGASAGDGYVIRWRNVHGDSEGPRIPDADYLAVRSTGDKLLWAGVHPATGESVTINYWSGGHTLAVHAAGRLLFRIDRNHRVQ